MHRWGHTTRLWWAVPRAHSQNSLCQLTAIGIATLRILAQHNADKFADMRIDRRRQRRWCLVDVCHGNRDGGVALEGPGAGHHFVGDTAKRVDVCRRTHLFALRLLR